MVFSRSCGAGHRTATGDTAAKRAEAMQPVDEVVVLLGEGVPVACGFDEAAMCIRKAILYVNYLL